MTMNGSIGMLLILLSNVKLKAKESKNKKNDNAIKI
jgi:hypothetical protein